MLLNIAFVCTNPTSTKLPLKNAVTMFSKSDIFNNFLLCFIRKYILADPKSSKGKKGFSLLKTHFQDTH